MSTPQRSVPIVGVGVVSAAGRGVAATLASFQAGARQPGPVTLFSCAIACPVFEVADVPTEPGINARTFAMATMAAKEALTEARLTPEAMASRRVGVCLGTTVACQLNALDFYATLRATNEAPLDAVNSYLKGNLADAIGRRLGVTGPCVTVANACSSSADAIGVALSWLRLGLCDVAIAGGADELNRIPLTGFHSLSVMSPEPCRPFDRDRQGLNLGEGAGVIVLESDASARARGLRPELRLSGYGAAGDAYHMTAPRPDGAGLESAIRAALADAGIAHPDIAFVSAHGTATRDNDRTEGATLARVFGPDLRFLSTKGYTGHTLGAAGGMAAVFTALGLREGWLPANAGFQTPDPEIGIAPLRARTPVAGSHALATALAFGGSNAALVVSRSTADVPAGGGAA